MINQIILSCNEDPTYMEFWEPVSQAYKKIFPDVDVHLAFLTNRKQDDELVKHFRTFGRVTLFKPIPGLQEFTQAKLIRFILAARQGSDVCYIDDIDLFPLKKSFITDKTDKRPKNRLLCVGGEVYNNNGCYPVSQMTAEGYIWRYFINPYKLQYGTLIRSYLDMPTTACEITLSQLRMHPVSSLTTMSISPQDSFAALLIASTAERLLLMITLTFGRCE